MPIGSTSCERYIGGFYVAPEERHDAIFRGRRVRYIIVLDSYADAVAWRRLMSEEDSFVMPLSQAAGEAANQLRDALANIDAVQELKAKHGGQGGSASSGPPPLERALKHIQALLSRSPSSPSHTLDGGVETCAYCEAPVNEGRHADGCAWQAARRFLLEQALEDPVII
jgi:hypothetical protein